MKFIAFCGFVVTVLVFAGYARAEDAARDAKSESKSAAPVATSKVKADVAETVATPKNWKTTFQSYFYDFEGTRASSRAAYNFGLTTLAMQMLTVEYKAPGNWTLMVIGQHYKNRVITNMFGMSFDDTTEGFADTYLMAMHSIVMDGSFMLFGDFGATLPTGSIDKRNKAAPQMVYAYNMQLGSGTIDAIGGLTALYFAPKAQLGSRLSTTMRNGPNQNGYSLGALYKLDAWVDVPVGWGFTPRVVGYYKHKDQLRGEDKTLARQPLTEFYYHDQINWDVSVAMKYSNQVLPSLALNAEFGAPVAQGMTNYDDAVVSTNYYGSLGVSGTF
jgi:hypothetical protein